MLSQEMLDFLEERENDYFEYEDVENIEPDLGKLWGQIHELKEEYLARYGSEQWKQGYLCGYKDAEKIFK